MATQFEQGRYLVRILDQGFIESQKGTVGFSLVFRVIRRLDDSNEPVKPYQGK
jgi:hypothetical protein